MRAPRHEAASDSDLLTFAFGHAALPLRGEAERFRDRVRTIEAVGEGRDPPLLQARELLAARPEDEVQFVRAHATASLAPNFRWYASMNGSIAPSMTFWTSVIFNSVLWSFTIV